MGAMTERRVLVHNISPLPITLRGPVTKRIEPGGREFFTDDELRWLEKVAPSGWRIAGMEGTPDTEESYRCPECERVFEKRMALRMHRIAKHGIRKFPDG